LKEAPKEVLDVLVCLYPRPGKISGARVSAVKFSKKWSVDKATDWIKKNKLHTWSGELIRHKHKTSEEKKELTKEEEDTLDETLNKVLEAIAKKAEEPPSEEKKLSIELKKKKLELIKKWLEANEK